MPDTTQPPTPAPENHSHKAPRDATAENREALMATPRTMEQWAALLAQAPLAVLLGIAEQRGGTDLFALLDCPQGGTYGTAGASPACPEWQRGDVLHRHWRSLHTGLVVLTPNDQAPARVATDGGISGVGLT